jgi:hypothetical protein
VFNRYTAKLPVLNTSPPVLPMDLWLYEFDTAALNLKWRGRCRLVPNRNPLRPLVFRHRTSKNSAKSIGLSKFGCPISLISAAEFYH